MDVFVLAGQSNMAGRGDILELPTQYSQADREVMCFTAKGDWIPAMEPLHKDVDLRKQHRCGVGPGLVCARALLKLRGLSPSPGRRIGLVPCAIGGASLDEWQKGYTGAVGDCEAPKGIAAVNDVQANAPWGYKPGSRNLFGAMAERIEEALKAAPEGSSLSGVLWYQGETDAMKEGTADTYRDRFQVLVDDVRGLGYPDLQFFTVAVTATSARLPHLRKVRDAQLHAGSPSGVSGVWVTEAFGLPMYTDGLHLMTNGQVELGERMALQVFAAGRPATPGGGEARDSTLALGQGAGGWAREEARREIAHRDLNCMAAMARSKRKSKHETISQVTKDLEGLITSLTSRGDDDTAATRSDTVKDLPPTKSPVAGAASSALSEEKLPTPPRHQQRPSESSAERCATGAAGAHKSSQPPPMPPSSLSRPIAGEDTTTPHGRDASEEGAGIASISGLATFGADSKGRGSEATRAADSLNDCPETDCNRPNFVGPESNNLPCDGSTTSRGSVGLEPRGETKGLDREPQTHASLGGTVAGVGHLPQRGFASSVSSEVNFHSFAKLLFFLRPTPEERLLVLGCGAGNSVMASALLYRWRQIQGMDLMQGCLDEARGLLSVYSEGPYPGNNASDGRGTTRSGPLSPEEGVDAERTPAYDIRLDEGDFAEGNWGDATLVYAASAYFDDALISDIARKCRGLREGARVVTLDKPLPVFQSRYPNRQAGNGEFRVAWQCQVDGCWDGSAVAYVHHRGAGPL